MKLPRFRSQKKLQELSSRDEELFAEASALAQLRLEQCRTELEIRTQKSASRDSDPQIFIH
jgi:hypothetical protein